jgi:hypothetical protein
MRVRDIEILRDGGTIAFTIEDGALAGSYRLRTPLAGEPRPVFRNEEELARGGHEEAHLLAELQTWLADGLTSELQVALERLDALPEWRNLPEGLRRATPLYHMRTVVRCLEARTPPRQFEC